MTWAHADKPQMTARLTEASTKAGNANKALVIPLRDAAFLRSWKTVREHYGDAR
jgi:hypothetical protein